MKRVYAVVILALLSTAQFTFADCTGTIRKATKAEMDFELKIKAAVRGALPPAPAGWALERDDKVSAADSVCVSGPAEPMRVELGRSYARTRTKADEDREQALLAAFQQSMSSPQGKKIQEIMTTVQAQAEKLAGPIQKAAARNDMKELQRLSDENAKVAEAAQRQIEVLEAQMKKDLMARTEKLLPHDTTASVTVYVNYPLGQPEGAKQVTVPGAAAAFRTPGERNGESDWREGTTTLYLGNWRVAAKAAGAPSVQPGMNKAAPPTKAQILAIRITADSQRTDQLLKQINLPALEALLK